MTTEQWERENQDTLMEYFIDGDPRVRRIQCEYCRKIIYTQTRNRKYCSFQTCGHKILNLRKSLKKRVERGTYTCPCYGEQFLPIRADARYETHPADRLRQCVFAGTTNRQDFLPRDRTGNRRFIPIPVDAELDEVHILDDEDESRAYIDQLWAEAMSIYNSGNYKLAFSPAMQETLQAHQQDFMQEDAQAGMIYTFLEDYAGDRVCSKQLYAEALGNCCRPDGHLRPHAGQAPVGADRENRSKLLFPRSDPGNSPSPAKRKAGGNKNHWQRDS